MVATLKDGNLNVSLQHFNLKDLPDTKSHLSRGLSTSGGATPVPMVINGKQEIVEITISAYVRIPSRKKVKDENGKHIKTIDTVTKEEWLID